MTRKEKLLSELREKGMNYAADEIEKLHYYPNDNRYNEIDSCFGWNSTKQGYLFWLYIETRMYFPVYNFWKSYANLHEYKLGDFYEYD